jgi:hypothetical protein
MKVHQLIKVLQSMPQEAFVLHLWDGAPRTAIEHVWLSRDGIVITADCGMHCYANEDRPSNAPTQKEDSMWYTPSEPMTPCLPDIPTPK